MAEQKLLLLAALLFVSSILLFVSGWKKSALALLVLASFFCRYWAAGLYPFLNDWDERFHALVGKNMMLHPWKPTLVERPVLEYDWRDWTSNHVWVHKQPLFLWQIGFSVLLFGVSEIAVRLPSIVLSSLLVLLTYRIGRLAFDERTGFSAAVLVASSFQVIQLVTGVEGMDHNDISFMFYVTASVWAWMEYEQKKNIRWAWAMGALAGAAILCKWTVGLLVFGIFGFHHLIMQRDIFSRPVLIALIQSFVACLLVALPWQAYIFISFPIEAAWEYSFNIRHFSEVLEGHQQSYWYYMKQLNENFRVWYPLIIVGLGVVLINKEKRSYRWSLLAGIIVVYLFFSLAATKLPAYVLVVLPLVNLLIAAGFIWLTEKLFGRLKPLYFNTLLILMLCIGAYYNLNPYGVFWSSLIDDSNYGKNRLAKKVNTESFKSAARTLPKDYVIVWCHNFERIECMFYTGNTAYGPIEDYKVMDLHKRGVKLAVFQRQDLPDYIRNDSLILKLPFEMKPRVAD